MNKNLMRSLAALACAGLAPLAAHAADDGSGTPSSDQPSYSLDQVSLGVEWLSGSNTNLFGRYNGFTEQGFDFLGSFDVQKRDAWNSGHNWYFTATGENLNFQTGDRLAKGFQDNDYTNNTSNDLGPTASVNLRFGDQGAWDVNAGYDAISYTGNVINSIYSINGTTATLNNNLPPWGGASNDPLTVGPITSYTTLTLSPAEKPVQVGTRRDIVQIGGDYLFEDWTLSANVRHEHKQGTLEESLRETYGGQAFALPIDYDTDRFDIQAAYNTPDMQAIFQYTYSRFADNNSGVVIPFPVSIAALSSTSGPYAQSALYSTPPSTSAHYFTAMFGDRLAPQTRLVVNGRVGIELQDDTFPANSADPNLSNMLGNPEGYHWFDNLNSHNQGTSANSPNARAWVYQGNATLSTQIDTGLDGKMSYSFDGRDVSLNQYLVWIGGSSPDATANTAVYVVPQNWFKQTATAELNYLIVPESSTKLTAEYSFNDTNRTNAQVEHSTTNTAALRLISMIGKDLLTRLTYEHAVRSGTLIYGTAWGNLEAGAPEEFGTPSGAYYQAPMISDTVIARADYAPAGEVTGGLFLKYVDERFHYPSIPFSAPAGDWTLVGHGEGIKEDYNLSVGPDINYRPSQDINLHAYYTFERIFFDNLGNGACAESNTGNCEGSAGYFRNTYSSDMHTAGLSGDWQYNPKLKLGLEYNMSIGSVVFGEFNGVFVTSVSQSYQNVVPYPDINSQMHQLRLTATYQFSDRIDCALIYQYSMFRNDDWNNLTAPVQPTTDTGTTISILTPGYPPPKYNVSMIGTVIRVAL